jgi:uncharacterized NAD-dependent epimerase/dehydratase family protein
MKPLVYALLLLASFPLAAGDMTFEQVKAMADSDEAGLSAEQERALVESQGSVAHPTFAGCRTSDLADRRLPFTVVMELDATGKVQRTWRSGASAIAECMNRALRAATLTRPPKAPFYSSFEYHFEGQ